MAKLMTQVATPTGISSEDVRMSTLTERTQRFQFAGQYR